MPFALLKMNWHRISKTCTVHSNNATGLIKFYDLRPWMTSGIAQIPEDAGNCGIEDSNLGLLSRLDQAGLYNSIVCLIIRKDNGRVGVMSWSVAFQMFLKGYDFIAIITVCPGKTGFKLK